jgi:hypothetical protein
MDRKAGKDTDAAWDLDEAASTGHRLQRRGTYPDIEGEVGLHHGVGRREGGRPS